MKERPILMSGPLVVQTMKWFKTQTRRVMTCATGPSLSVECHGNGRATLSWLTGAGPGYPVDEQTKEIACPYGVPGDRLWVRETWAIATGEPNDRNAVIRYRSDMALRPLVIPPDWSWAPMSTLTRFHPSIHMPRWASRLTLEIVEVRAQRLQDISEADARAEGVLSEAELNVLRLDMNDANGVTWGRDRFKALWDSINSKRLVGGKPVTWEANPYVWAITYRVVQP